MAQRTARKASGKVAAAPAAAEATSHIPAGDGAPTTTRDRILDVALDLFTRKGYAETSLREIAVELGFSKAALYYHFASKQDILLALHTRLHSLTADVLPLLQEGADTEETWTRLLDLLIGLALRNRRLLEMHARNQEAIAELHRDPEKHGAPPQPDVEQQVLGLLRDPATPLTQRVRRVASIGAVMSVLLAAGAFADVSDAELEGALREVVRDVLRRT